MSGVPHRLRVYTYKTGLLSRVAHDLRLSAEHFELRVEGDRVEAQVRANSLRVDGVMRDGRLHASQLSARDRAKIAETIRSKVLRTRTYPEIHFRGVLDPGPPLAVRGTLSLMGVSHALQLRARREGDRLRARFELRPTRYSIPPYEALAGAIRLQDRVAIELDLDAALAGAR